MTEVDDHLIRCFSSVFANLSTEEIRTASVETISAWDSLAAVTLIGVIEEEFGVQVDLSDLEVLASFEAIRNYLHKLNATPCLTSTPSIDEG